ncbi:uncharacterized protein TM35_000111410 [Trypanosoma theileri]|uniref:Uncharacterized protein n=1 Tax=Trypanosoma theileri TaxID=67003 RepID=A0A1X0NY60_9TRYP|nr:uncharacterized protein TM35_000111410 [Trypanosoma theileri]ORC89607.1 hypothetical protein TM35_000111410 [Trypanosoma theileri]
MFISDGYLQSLTSVPYTLFSITLPWFFLVLYVVYYYIKRPREFSTTAIAPFLLFMDYLTDGATAGYDKPLMNLFHPELIGNYVDRGLLRAMVRCLCKRVGKVVHIPRDTAMMKSRGNNVNFIALVDFQYAKQVKCRISWTWRPTGNMLHTKNGPIRPFYVTGFRVEPAGGKEFDVVEFLRTDDFVPFAESFVERLFERPPKAAVEMMVPALQERYVNDLDKLQRSIQHVCGTTEKTAGEPNITLVGESILRASTSANTAAAAETDGNNRGEGNTAEDTNTNTNTSSSSTKANTPSGGDAKGSAIQGIEFRFFVNGISQREMEVTVAVVFAGLRCYVNRYEVRALPDTRTQVVLDHDTGEKTIVA